MKKSEDHLKSNLATVDSTMYVHVYSLHYSHSRYAIIAHCTAQCVHVFWLGTRATEPGPALTDFRE